MSCDTHLNKKTALKPPKSPVNSIHEPDSPQGKKNLQDTENLSCHGRAYGPG
jgi:hypothetical protein